MMRVQIYVQIDVQYVAPGASTARSAPGRTREHRGLGANLPDAALERR
jgi:hypothetical protein